MSTLKNNAPATETLPAIEPIPAETMPENPNDPFDVSPQIIQEIEEIGRKYTRR